MRIHINLASQPYEAARNYQQRLTMIIAGLGIVAVLLAGYIVYQRHNTRSIDGQMADAQGQIHALDNEEAQARALLNKPANRVIADQSDFLNQLFARKALSWTHIFTEMEKIVPAGLHVVSMKPDYTKSGDLVLHVLVATDTRDRAVELVRRMEKSSHLKQAQIVAEAVTTNSSDQSAGGGNIQFDIAALYVPGGADNDEPAPAADDKKAEPPPPAPVRRATVAPQQLTPHPNVAASQPITGGATPPPATNPTASANVPPTNAAPGLASAPIYSPNSNQPRRPFRPGIPRNP